MRFPSLQTLTVAVPLVPLLAGGFPSESSAQGVAWSGQAEVFFGRYSPDGKRAGVMAAGGSEGRVEMAPSLMFGGRLFFPVAGAPSRQLGQVSLGVRGLVVPGADLEIPGASGGIGTANHYEFLGTVSVGDFLAGGDSGINLRLNGLLGAGVGHTSYNLDPGVGWTEGDDSHTGLVLSAGVGGDLLLAPWLSLVAHTSWSWGIGNPDHGSVAERSFTAMGGLALRWPFRGGPNQ